VSGGKKHCAELSNARVGARTERARLAVGPGPPWQAFARASARARAGVRARCCVAIRFAILPQDRHPLSSPIAVWATVRAETRMSRGRVSNLSVEVGKAIFTVVVEIAATNSVFDQERLEVIGGYRHVAGLSKMPGLAHAARVTRQPFVACAFGVAPAAPCATARKLGLASRLAISAVEATMALVAVDACEPWQARAGSIPGTIPSPVARDCRHAKLLALVAVEAACALAAYVKVGLYARAAYSLRGERGWMSV